MKHHRLSSLCTALVVAVSSLCAAGVRAETIDELLKRYDANKDGSLSRAELARARAENAKATPARAALGVDDLLLRYDKDKNGSLNGDELKRALDDAAVIDPALAGSVHELLGKYDKNKSGSLSRSELASARMGAVKAAPAPPADSASDIDLIPAPRLAEIKKEEAEKAAKKKEKAKSLTNWLEENVGISKTYQNPGEEASKTDPARISWMSKKGSESTYSIDASVQWRSPFLHSATKTSWGAFGWDISPAFEAHIDSTDDKDKRKNTLTYHLPVMLDFEMGKVNDSADAKALQPPSPWITQHFLKIDPRYETDRENSIATGGLQVLYSPTIPKLALGVSHELPLTFFGKPMRFHWRPWAGVEFGSVTKGFKDETTQATTTTGESVTTGSLRPASQKEFGFFVANLTGQLDIGFNFALTADWKHLTQLGGGAGSHNYLDLSAVWKLDGPEGHYSIGASYLRGEMAPKFEDQNSVEIWLGVQF